MPKSPLRWESPAEKKFQDLFLITNDIIATYSDFFRLFQTQFWIENPQNSCWTKYSIFIIGRILNLDCENLGIQPIYDFLGFRMFFKNYFSTEFRRFFKEIAFPKILVNKPTYGLWNFFFSKMTFPISFLSEKLWIFFENLHFLKKMSFLLEIHEIEANSETF